MHCKFDKLLLTYKLCHLRKNTKNSDTRKIAVIIQKLEQYHFYCRVMGRKDADGMANSVDPDQTAPRSSLIWVCTVCPLFAQTCLSENLGSLRYFH